MIKQLYFARHYGHFTATGFEERELNIFKLNCGINVSAILETRATLVFCDLRQKPR